MYGLDKKRAVITGAASGLGRSLATVLAGDGWKICVVDIHSDEAQQTLEMVTKSGGSGEVFHADVRMPENIKALADHCFNNWGGVDLLINNAGVAVAGFIGEIPLEAWKWIVDVNLWGVVHGCHEFIPRMKAQGGGHIVNVASAAGLLSLAEMGPYNSTKAAIIALSETLRVETAPYNIGITVACPMFFNTNLLHDMRCTDDWECELGKAAFKYSRMTSDEVAQTIVEAARKGRLYAIPQLSGRLFWLHKRLSPSLYYGLFTFLSRHGVSRSVAMRLARWGLL